MKQELKRVLDICCVVCVFLVPVFGGSFFVILLSLDGAPEWYLIVHGILFAASVVGLIHLIALGLFRAVRQKDAPKAKGE